MTTAITTVEALAELPVGTQVGDRDGDFWFKGRDRTWLLAQGNDGMPSERMFQLWSPLAVTGQPELHMVRCCVTGCTTTAPLAPGSTLICPEHGGEHHDIKGDS